MSTTTEQIPEEAIRLFTVQDEDGQVDATVPVRWCISRETAEMIQKRGISEPKLVIVVEHDGRETDRYVVPLESEMRYIQFRRPGGNVIHATIVWGSEAESMLNSRFDSGGYRVPLLAVSRPGVEKLEKQDDELGEQLWRLEDSSDAKADEISALNAQREGVRTEIRNLRDTEPEQCHMRHNFDDIHSIDSTAELGVTVPEELFAGKPPRWMNWLGHLYDGWWSRKAPRDQCDLRRRALITLATLLPVTLFQLIALVCIEAVDLAFAGLLLFVGARNINFASLRHPFQYSPKDMQRDLKPSVWWHKKVVTKNDDGRVIKVEYKERNAVTIVINPPVVVFFTAVGFGCYLLWGSLTFLYLGVAAAFIIAVIGCIVAVLFEGPVASFVEKHTEKRARDREEQERLDRESLRKELEQLACSSASREVSLSALPKERRTVYLRYQNLKSKVCRPFAS